MSADQNEVEYPMCDGTLINLLDALTETSVYVIEEGTHKLLYFNKRCQETGRGKAALGVECYDIWPELCINCPLETMGDKNSNHIVRYDPVLKTMVDVIADRVLWNGHIPSIVITAIPHMPNFEEMQGRKKIEEMYAQSLVTIFDECIIANLTADYYINCQKDTLWTDIPQQGNFAAENLNQAKELMHPKDLELFIDSFSQEALLRLFQQGKRHVSRRLRRLASDGTYHMMEFAAAKIEHLEDDEYWCVLVFRDVQDEFLLEQKWNIEISQLATAAQIAYQMVIAVNLTRNTYHMLEYDRFPVKKPGNDGSFDDLIQTELATVHPDHQAEFISKFSRASLTNAFSHGAKIVSMEVPHIGKDGVYHWNFTQVVQVESPYTDDMIEITLSRNIDEERRLQEEALEKERRAKQVLEEALDKAKKASQAKSDFLSKMSHDIRTPMNAILGMTELAQLHIGDEKKLKDYLGKIASSGAHLLGLINEVLDVNKIESGTIRLEESEFDLHDLMRDVVELVRLPLENKKQALTVKIGDGLHSRVLGDVRRLKQVLVNILENASKYTKEGGQIVFSMDELEKDEQRVGTYRFIIEDNGIGMKPQYLKHIFEPFSRADDSRISKITGTGLGMTIVQNLVAIMGGDIRVESEYGKGSRFIISLCLSKCDAPAQIATIHKPVTEESFPGLKILLVEDNELNRQIATEMLELLGTKVEIAVDGQKAVEAVCSHPPHYYDIVFMDIQMPVMNGYDATRQIRNLNIEGVDDLPIIAMTADAFVEDAKQARLAGLNGHLTKPISMKRLKSVLSHRLNQKQQLSHRKTKDAASDTATP